MNANKKRLGRGLASLLGTEEGGFEPSSLEAAELSHIPVDQIDANPFQPRREFDPAEIAALADSLRQHGMLQPILVRPVGDRYQVIAGERRLRACIEARLHEVHARVMDLDDQRVSELAIVENLQREDLNAVEKANAFRRYLDTYGGTQEELAGRLGVDRSTLTNLLRLLDLPAEVLEAVRNKKISQGHARTLLGLESADERVAACQRIIAESLSVRQTEALVATGEPTSPRIRKDSSHAEIEKGGSLRAPHLVDLESRLSARFQAPVLIRYRGKSRGQIVIDFHDQTEFDRITALIHGESLEAKG